MITSLVYAGAAMLPVSGLAQGWMSNSAMLALSTFIAAVLCVGYVALRSEWSERFRDPALTDAAAVANSGGIGFCVGLVDLDRFKQINDKRGHAQGDTLLHDFAQTATRRLRASDMLGRWGGEEFLIVFPGTAPDGAARIVERLHAALREIPIAGCLVTLSAGISAYIDRAKTRTPPSPGTMRPCMPPITVGATRYGLSRIGKPDERHPS